MADCLVRDSYLLTQHDGPATAAELLGIDAAAIHKAVSYQPAGSDNREPTELDQFEDEVLNSAEERLGLPPG